MDHEWNITLIGYLTAAMSLISAGIDLARSAGLL